MLIIDLISSMLEASWLSQLADNLSMNLRIAGFWGSNSQSSILCQMSPCESTLMTPVAAAFATQGFYAQADLIWWLTNPGYGLTALAPLLYTLSVAGGLISLALGAPPKMYLWFILGPFIYQWLLFSQAPTQGVLWKVGGVAQDQSVVYRLAEVGLVNSRILKDGAGMGGPAGVWKSKSAVSGAPKVGVSAFFLWFDSIVSNVVQLLIELIGPANLESGPGGLAGLGSNTAGVAGGQSGPSNIMSWGQGKENWLLLSGVKWGLLENITSARLTNANVRDLFATFMNSECGEQLVRSMDEGSLVQAANSSSGSLPCSLFKKNSSAYDYASKDCYSDTGADYSIVTANLRDSAIPIPDTARKAFGISGLSKGTKVDGSFYAFLGGTQEGLTSLPSGLSTAAAYRVKKALESNDSMNCADLLYLVVNGFRWEAGHILAQVLATAPAGVSPDGVLFNLFYGWNIRSSYNGDNGRLLRFDFTFAGGQNEVRNFATDLILVHLFKNELATMPNKMDRRYLSATQQHEVNAEGQVAVMGAKQKFGEFYTWAMMIPYIQGVLLYFFAMAYPLACVMIVIPGWHRMLFTWMSFWFWVKIWDVGLAIVMVLERSVWAMLVGNNPTSSTLSQYIAPMQSWSTVNVSLPGEEMFDMTDIISTGSSTIPLITDGGGGGMAGTLGVMVGGAGNPTWDAIIRIFDRAVLVGTSMDLDLQSGYYLYIMTALYFAIPAVCGQLVLGAKAGAAGMANQLMGGANQDGSRGVSAGYNAGISKIGNANAATVNQEAYAKALRQSGLANKAIHAGNQGLAAGLESNMLNTQNSAMGAYMQNLGRTQEVANAAMRASDAALRRDVGWKMAGINFGAGVAGSAGQFVGGFARPAGAGESLPAAGGAGESGPVPGGGLKDGYQSFRKNAGWMGGTAGAGSQMARSAAEYWGTWAQDIDAREAQYGWMLGAQMSEKSAEQTAQQASNAIRQAGLSAAQSGYGMYERRAGAEADLKAQMAAWEVRRDWSNQAASYLAGTGVDTSFASPGNKPTDMSGMAMSGMLGGSARVLAGYASPDGEYWGQANDRLSDLNSSYGYKAVKGAYVQTDPGFMRDEIMATENSVGRHSDPVDYIQGQYDQTKDGTYNPTARVSKQNGSGELGLPGMLGKK